MGSKGKEEEGRKGKEVKEREMKMKKVEEREKKKEGKGVPIFYLSIHLTLTASLHQSARRAGLCITYTAHLVSNTQIQYCTRESTTGTGN